MKLEALRTIFAPQELSTAPEDRLVYSRDASRLEGECLGVVWPSDADQLSALVQWAGEQGVDLVPRGAGTGLCGGATPQGSLVVDLSRLQQVGPVEREGQQIEVGAGVVLADLNRALAADDLFLPVVPGSQRAATLGGMIATDAAGLRAVRYGSMGDWVQQVLLVDGLGAQRRLRDGALRDVVGREGVTGFIVAATLRLAPRPQRRTLALRAFSDEPALLEQRDRWLADERLTALEYLNRHAAQAIGWPAQPHLLAEFEPAGGDSDDPQQVLALWRAREGLYPRLAGLGFPQIEDPQVSDEALLPLLNWLEEQGIPAFGHLGLGIIHPCLPADDPRVADLYQRVADWGGQVSGEHGIGLKKKPWAAASFCATIQRLKERYDPQGIINRGKLC
jgi:FAD/FMN-containing dehydrogenase